MRICVVHSEVMEIHKILSQLFSEQVSNASVTYLDYICACFCNTFMIIILQSCETEQLQTFSYLKMHERCNIYHFGDNLTQLYSSQYTIL